MFCRPVTDGNAMSESPAKAFYGCVRLDTRLRKFLTRIVAVCWVCACSKKTVANAPVHLRRSEWTLVASGDFAATGELNEACVDLPATYGYSTERRRILRTGHDELQLSARFRDDSGVVISFDEPNAFVVGGQEKQLCFSERAWHSRPYRAIELRASDSLSLGRITWWSGKPRKLL